MHHWLQDCRKLLTNIFQATMKPSMTISLLVPKAGFAWKGSRLMIVSSVQWRTPRTCSHYFWGYYHQPLHSVTSNFLFISYSIHTKFEILHLVHHINILQVLVCCEICSVVKRKTAICHSLSRCPPKFVTDRTRGGDRT